MQYEIVSMKKEDILEVANLHCLAFPQSRSTRLGRPYVRKMFRWFLKYQPGLCFIARHDEEIAGYVVGAIGGYGRKLFRYALFEIILGLLTHPNLWHKTETFMLWRSYAKGLLPNFKKANPGKVRINQTVSAALAGIGVIEAYQGQGIGKALTLAFEDAATCLGATRLTLSVHMNNTSARRLYESCGWVMDQENEEAQSAHYTKVIF